MEIQRIIPLILKVNTYNKHEDDIQGDFDDFETTLNNTLDVLREHSIIIDVKITSSTANHTLIVVYNICVKSLEDIE